MKRLVLVGGGHAHAFVLRDWLALPLPGVELVLVSPTRFAPYSGMVPGWLAGLYRFDEIGIDMAALAQACGARFIEDEVIGLDPVRRLLALRQHETMRFDVASLNVGSTLYAPTHDTGQAWLSMRPLSTLRERWDAMLAAPQHTAHVQRVVTAGAGPAGVESVLAVMTRLRARHPSSALQGLLLTRDDDILPTHSAAVRQATRRALQQAGVQVQTGCDASSFVPAQNDVALWATGAQAHRWPAASGLEVDAQGFVRIDSQLRSRSHPAIHAVGDCAAWATPLPKAGVIAVRQGPVLSNNLRAAVGTGVALPYRPQRRHLALLSTGDGRAIASWGALTTSGHWVWRWKDHIDRKFLRRFAV